jgi:hypothetical protein
LALSASNYLENLIKKELKNHSRRKFFMTKGKFEKVLVESYLPKKMVPPEYIRDTLQEAEDDFPIFDFEYSLPHVFTSDEYRNRYEDLERHMIEILEWRQRWFGNQKPLEERTGTG